MVVKLRDYRKQQKLEDKRNEIQCGVMSFNYIPIYDTPLEFLNWSIYM